MDVSHALAAAADHYLAGRLEEAERLCRQVLGLDPRSAKGWRLLGLIGSQAGNFEVAIECLARAVQLQPEAALSHRALGAALEAQGKTADAEASYRKAAELDPQSAEAHFSLANVLRDQGKADEAIDCYRRALQLKPDSIEASVNLGNLLALQGQLDEAIACHRRVLQLQPTLAEAHNNLGAALRERYQRETQSGAAARPGSASNTLDEAIACWRRAVQLKPDYAGAYVNLGNALREKDDLVSAVDCFRRALDCAEKSRRPDIANGNDRLLDVDPMVRDPVFREAWAGLGICLHFQGKFEEAEACYCRVLGLCPGEPRARFARSLLMLLRGDFEQGWQEYEYRFSRR